MENSFNKKRRKRRPKVCHFCVDKATGVDYKDIEKLKTTKIYTNFKTMFDTIIDSVNSFNFTNNNSTNNANSPR